MKKEKKRKPAFWDARDYTGAMAANKDETTRVRERCGG